MVSFRHLAQWQGRRVPFIATWIDNQPEFSLLDSKKWRQCVNEKLCPICGEKLGPIGFIIGGSKLFFFEMPPMHARCAKYAATIKEIGFPDGEGLYLHSIRMSQVQTIGAQLLSIPHSIERKKI